MQTGAEFDAHERLVFRCLTCFVADFLSWYVNFAQHAIMQEKLLTDFVKFAESFRIDNITTSLQINACDIYREGAVANMLLLRVIAIITDVCSPIQS